MDLTTYVDALRHELSVAAGAGGDEARALAERLTAPLDSATRLVLLEALTAAADEITRDLAPGSVEVRLRGRDPGFVVTLPPSEEAFEATVEIADGDWATSVRNRSPDPAPQPAPDEGATSRINLRLPDSLKSRAEEASGREGLSLNAWLVRAVAAALDPVEREAPPHRRSPRGGERYTGWVR